jgi:DNA-binding MarR family transcriptional regulator
MATDLLQCDGSAPSAPASEPETNPHSDLFQVLATCWVGLFLRLSSYERRQSQCIAGATRSQGLNAVEFSILYLCATRGDEPVPQNELAGQLGISPAQISTLVERLRAKDLIQAQRPAKDRRKKFWQTTARGNELLSEILLDLKPWLDQLKRQVGWSQGCLLMKMLEQLNAIAASIGNVAPQHHTEPNSEHRTWRRVA